MTTITGGQSRSVTDWMFQEEELNNNRGEDRVRSTHHKTRAGRTGWPQHVWALELKQ